jgi:peptide/nickel transport system ATP-binding protein
MEPTGRRCVLQGTVHLFPAGGRDALLRAKMQIIFQDPFASLSPRMSIGKSIGHPLEIHGNLDNGQVRDRTLEIMEKVGLQPADFFARKYPHQISGGQRQRVVIARALITRPEFVVADEPIAMADVSVRAMILELMAQLKEEFDLTYLFITHDLATAKYICDRIAIMYLGRIMEIGPLAEVFKHPVHPYTESLLGCRAGAGSEVPQAAPHTQGRDPQCH